MAVVIFLQYLTSLVVLIRKPPAYVHTYARNTFIKTTVTTVTVTRKCMKKQVHPFGKTGAPIWQNRCMYLSQQVHQFWQQAHALIADTDERLAYGCLIQSSPAVGIHVNRKLLRQP